MKEFSKITNPADVLDSQHFLQVNKIFLIHQNDDNQTNVCECAASAETDGFREPSVSAPISFPQS